VTSAAGGRLASVLASGAFAVTGEVVPPRSANSSSVSDHARELVGYVDAVNVTDNPLASAHMSALAGVAAVARAGVEATLQVTTRDRNRLAITADLLGGWALGARNILCLSGDPIHVGDHPDAAVVNDLSLLDVVALARQLATSGRTLGGTEISEPPRFLIGVADMPLADPYEPARLERKLDAGADVVFTQIAYDVERLAAWAEHARARGVFERASVVVGLVPLRSAAGARFMDEKMPGVRVPPDVIRTLEAAGSDAPSVGLQLTVDVVNRIRAIDGMRGVHLMGMGHDESVRAVVEGAGLFPRPTAQPR
jgi:methylenetetrahydrofolate reductase (NADPH)